MFFYAVKKQTLCSLNSWSLSDKRPSKHLLLIKLSINGGIKTPACHTLTRRPTSFWSVRWNKDSGDHERVFFLLAAHIYTLPLSLAVCEIRVSALIWCVQGGTREASFEDEQVLRLKKAFFHQRAPAACFTPTPPLTSFSQQGVFLLGSTLFWFHTQSVAAQSPLWAVLTGR